jgi:predicted dehydrogenase
MSTCRLSLRTLAWSWLAWSISTSSARAASTHFHAKLATNDLQELLALDPDGIVIATPHDTHFELARQALRGGVHVLVEKPMVLTPAHARELVDRARDQSLHLQVGYTFPFNPHVRLLRDSIREGALGDLQLVSALFATAAAALYVAETGQPIARDGALWGPQASTYNNQKSGGGQLYTQLTHSASLVLLLTGLEPRKVHAFTGPSAEAVDQWDALNFKTATGAVASLASTGTVFRHADRVEEYRIFGTQGHALLDTARGRLRIVMRDREIVGDPISEAQANPVQAPVDAFVDAILDHRSVDADGELGLRTVELLDAALHSARIGSEISIGAIESTSS